MATKTPPSFSDLGFSEVNLIQFVNEGTVNASTVKLEWPISLGPGEVDSHEITLGDTSLTSGERSTLVALLQTIYDDALAAKGYV